MDASTALDTTPVATDDAVGLLATVADPVRWRVLRLLASGQACVCEIQEQVPVASNLLSYHLRVLREAGLITSSKRGRWVDYRLAPDAGSAIAAALPVGAPVQP